MLLIACVVVRRSKDSLDSEADYIMLVTYLTAGIVSPMMGAVIDRIGLRYGYRRVTYRVPCPLVTLTAAGAATSAALSPK